MSIVMMEAWKCDVCGWCWPKRASLPSQCAASWCRSRGWNGSGEAVKPFKQARKHANPPAMPADTPPERPIAPDPPPAQNSSATYTRPEHPLKCPCTMCDIARKRAHS